MHEGKLKTFKYIDFVPKCVDVRIVRFMAYTDFKIYRFQVDFHNVYIFEY